MKRTTIGNCGLQIPPIVFGTSALGNLYTALDDEVKLKIVQECFKHVPKPVVFDTAGKYGAGLALEMLGKTLEKLGISPDDVIISNKLGWLRTELKTPEPTFEPGVWHNLKHDAVQNISYKGILECFEQGNELLGGKYSPQMVSVHDPDEYIANGKNADEKQKLTRDIVEGYRALSDLKKKGIVKTIGIGAKNWRTILDLEPHIDLDWVMFANSMTIMQQPRELLEFMDKLHRKGIAIINSAVFHSGFLTGGDFFDYKLIDPNDETDRKRIFWRRSFFDICQIYNISPALACVQFALTAPGVAAISLNTSNPLRVKENVESVTTALPAGFFRKMVEAGLIDASYPYIS